MKSLNDPEGLGRVELQFPWLSDSLRSYWAPVAAPLAGKRRGVFFMPEIDDEVLVAFEHGSFDHPFIVGYLWNGVDPPPESDLKNRVIRTPGGHTLRFEDGDGAKKVIVKSSNGHQIILDDAGTTVVVQLKGGGSINMTQDSLVLQHGHTITITAQGIALA
ncbi:MAG: phage baseplate assembly protein V [Candidatus Binatia bacterium]